MERAGQGAWVAKAKPGLCVLAALLLYAPGCGDDPATQVIVVVRSDLAAGTEIAELAVEVQGASGEPVGDQRRFELAAEPGDGKYALPLSFVVVPDEDEEGGRFRLVVRGVDGSGEEAIEYRVIAAFRSGRTVLLEVFLAKRCLAVLCRDEESAGDLTCRQDSGRCRPIEEQLDLPSVAPGSELTVGATFDAGSDASPASVTCTSGWQAGEDGACEDIDECEQDNGGCGDTRCENTPGSYACGDCEPGYAEDAKGQCLDIDECVGGTARCTAGMECRNVLGGFVCACPVGFEAGAECEDIDECGVDNGGCGAAVCYNSPGGYACGACDPGFGEDGSGACVDLDECESGSADCGEHARCTNTEGSFVCECDSGFEPSPAGCADIDECATDNGGCGSMACLDEEGSHSCSSTECATGFADCDMEPGCEVDTRSSVHHCGACDLDCTAHPNVAGATCSDGACEYGCQTGFGNCTAQLGCETRLNSLEHCGKCGQRCKVPNGTASCAAGVCMLTACNPGWASCNGDKPDGCEADLTSRETCGSCDEACADGVECINGGCGCGEMADCPSGFDCCSGSCIDTRGTCGWWPCVPGTARDVNHCGGCGVVCTQLACCG